MTTMPVRLDRLQAGLVALVSALLPTATVVWAPSEYPRESEAGLLVALRPIAGPRSTGSEGASVQTWTLPLSQTVVVEDVVEDDCLILNASGRRFEYRVGTGETSEDARDGLLAALAVPMVSATFVPGSDATSWGTGGWSSDTWGSALRYWIDIDALSLGDLYNVSVAGPLTLVTNTEQIARCQLDEVVSAIEVQVYSTSRYMMDGADLALSRLHHTLELEAARNVLDDYGLAVSPGSPGNLDSLAGPVWQSRAVSTWQVTQVALAAEPAGLIQSVSLGIQLRNGLGVESTATVLATEP